MALNFTGLAAALTTFLGIWFGHVAVRKIEYRAADLRLPTLAFLLAGALLEYASLSATNRTASVVLGIWGITSLWDALELTRQQKRIRIGHAPANPDNPRHARILVEHSQATTIDWLARDPLERLLTSAEIEAIRERQR
jgi:hypothetical protein